MQICKYIVLSVQVVDVGLVWNYGYSTAPSIWRLKMRFEVRMSSQKKLHLEANSDMVTNILVNFNWKSLFVKYISGNSKNMLKPLKKALGGNENHIIEITMVEHPIQDNKNE